MPLTRLDNLISSKTGKYLYVSPDDFNATDALSNRGNSPVTPFKSIQRAFLEIARYSYLPGFGNDRFDQFSIMLMPGIHYIDNRPGVADTNLIDVFGFDQANNEWTDNSILDISNPDNVLYKFNNTEGGAIIPRGSSLVGYDLRRTVVRPLYVPDPASVTVPRSAIFNVTGGCYFWQFTIKDGQTTAESPLYNNVDGTGEVYYDPTDFTKKNAPNYSHHKLTVFEYADTEELGLFYRKIAKGFSAYQPTIDDPGEFDTRVQENRIVGPLSDSRVIESLKFNDATTIPSLPASTSEIEVTTKVDHGYFAGQFVAISNTEIDSVLEGIFPIKAIDQNDPRKFTYEVAEVVSAIGTGIAAGQTISVDTTPALGSNALTLAEVDSVESASPYVFNCSIRSTWGICGIWANGLKATGFKSMVIAQYTGVSLQKDDRAFIRYDEYSNTWNQASLTDAFATVPYHTKGDSYWKDDWRNFHVRASEDAFIQNVSIFAVGFADHFLMESGGDMSITNSNSNFGNTSLHAIGFKGFAFNQDKAGYITDIIPPKVIEESAANTKKVQYYTIDIQGTIQEQSNYTKLFLGSEDIIQPIDRPAVTIQGYRLGAKSDEKLYVKLDPATAGGTEEFNVSLEPTGFVKYIAAPSILNPSGFSVNSVYSDAANLIESNRRMIQEEVFGYILEKYPRLQNISYVNPGRDPQANRYFDARNLIIDNRQQIVGTVMASLLDTYGGTSIQADEIGFIVDAVAEDLRDGGNYNIIEKVREYFNGDGTIDQAYLGSEEQYMWGLARARDLCKQAIANLLNVKADLYDPSGTAPDLSLKQNNPCGPIVNGYTGSEAEEAALTTNGVTYDLSSKDAKRYKTTYNLIENNRDFILDNALAEIAVYEEQAPFFYFPNDAQETARSRFKSAYRFIRRNSADTIQYAIDAINTQFPTFVFPNNSDEKCRRDLAYFIEAVGMDIFLGGNRWTREFIGQYFNGGNWVQNGLQGEEAQSIWGYNAARDHMILAVSNQLTGGYNERQVGVDGDPNYVPGISEGEAVYGDGNGDVQNTDTAACTDVQNAIASLTSIVTQVITDGDNTSITDPSDPNYVTPTGSESPAGEAKCRRDIGHILDAVQQDLWFGGNEYCVAAARAYFDRNGAPIPDGLLGEQSQSITAFKRVADAINRAINNRLYYKDNTITLDNYGDPVVLSDSHADGFNQLMANKVFIAEEAYERMLAAYPSYQPQPTNTKQDCLDDVYNVLDQVAWNLKFGGNSKTYDAAETYVTNIFAGLNPERFTPTDVTYDPATGVSVFSIPGHGMSVGDYIKIADNSITFTCALDNNATQHSYPRPGQDPYAGQWIQITANTINTITVNVGISSDTSAHTFISAATDSILKGVAVSTFLDPERDEAAKVFTEVNVIAQDVIRNRPVSVSNNTQSQQTFDGTLVEDWDSPGYGANSCAAVVSAFDTLMGIVIQAIGTDAGVGNINGITRTAPVQPTEYTIHNCSDVLQTVDTLIGIITDITSSSIFDPPAIDHGEWDCANVRSSIENLFDIALDAFTSSTLEDLPVVNRGSFITDAEASKCFRDVSYIVDAVVNDLRLGGNINSVQAGEAYYVGTSGTRTWTPTDATYDPATGAFTMTVAGHDAQVGRYIRLADNSFTFTCAMDNDQTQKTYPRPGIDPYAGTSILVTGTTADTITCNVGISGPNVSWSPSAVDYDPATGVMVCTIGAHSLSVGEGVVLQDNSFTFTCALDNNQTQHTYPRPGVDPFAGKSIAITATTATTITLNVGTSSDTSQHTFISATNNAIQHLPQTNHTFVSAATGALITGGAQLDYIDGEKTETIDAWNYVGQMATAAMRNFDFLAFNCSTTVGSAIIDIGDTRGVLIGMKVVEYDETDLVNPAYVNGLLQDGATAIYGNIPEETYVKRIVSNTEIELGIRGSRFEQGASVLAQATSSTTNLYFTFPQGSWADTEPTTVVVGPESEGPDVIQDTLTSPSQRECAGTADAIETLVGNITTIINSGVGSVTRVEQTANIALFASRATVFTINTTGTGASNPHDFETGTPVRLVPRPRFDTTTGKYVDVDKRLVRLPNGFETNTTYYVIAPGRTTAPNDFSNTTFFNGSDQTKLMLATSRENAAAGIYLYSSESESIDKDVEIDIYQFVLDTKYDLHNYKSKLTSAINAGIETDVPHIFDVPFASVTPHKVFFREVEGGTLPEVSTTYAADADVAVQDPNDANFGKINPQIEFFARYQNDRVFTIHKTHADAINNVNPITFVPGQTITFNVYANKRRSPVKFDPSFSRLTNKSGKWYVNCKDEGSANNLQAIRENNIFWRIKQSDLADRNRSTDMWYTRLEDERGADDRTYKIRYVIPKYIENARDPINGFVIKTKTDDTRKLVPQKLLLKPVAGTVYGARFENPRQAGEFIGVNQANFDAASLNIDAAYDPYLSPAYARFNSGIQATIQSARYVEDRLDPSIEYLEMTVFDHTVDTLNFGGLRNESFTTVKINAPQGGEWTVNKTESTTANQITWSGNSTGLANLHAYMTVNGEHYLILKNVRGGKLEFSEYYNTRFQQGTTFADMLEDQDMGKSLPLKTLIKKKYPEYFYKQNGANVYTITPGDRIQDDAGVEYYVESVEDAGIIDDTFYVFSYETLQRRIAGQQDGVYYLSCLRGNISPFPTGAGAGGNFRKFNFSQPVSRLYPLDYKNDPLWFKKNGTSTEELALAVQSIDPPSTFSAADNYIHGLVTTNDYKNSVTRELVEDFINQPAFIMNDYSGSNAIQAQEGNATSGSEDRKIKISGNSTVLADQKYYVELRRPSIARAGNHTFEYLGFGPGNYSTGLPARQEIVLTATEDFYAQSKKQDGGIVFYTGLNSNGDLYIGNRKINAITGEETFLEAAVLESSADDDEDIGNLVTTFDTPVTFNQNITVVGGDGSQQNVFQSPVVISVQDNDLSEVRDTLIIRSNVSSVDPITNLEQDESLDRTAFKVVNDGDIRISKNRVQAAVFGFNARGTGQEYQIQTHITNGIPSNITPNNNSVPADGGDRVYANQFVSYNGVAVKAGDILLKGVEVGKTGSWGWIYANYFQTIAQSNIFTIEFDATNIVKLTFIDDQGVNVPNSAIGLTSGSQIRLNNYPDSRLNSVWSVFSPNGDAFDPTNNYVHFQIIDAIPANTLSWGGVGGVTDVPAGQAAATIDFSNSNWKEMGVVGAEALRTNTETIGDYKLGINTIARASHIATQTAWISDETDPRANLDVVGNVFITGKTVPNFLTETTVARTENPMDNALLVGGDSNDPDDDAVLRVMTTNGGRLGVNTSVNDLVNPQNNLDQTLVVVGTGRITGDTEFSSDIQVNGGDLTTTNNTFNFVPQNANILNWAGEGQIFNFLNNTTVDQSINIANSSGTQTLQIGNAATQSSLRIHRNSTNAIVDIASVGDDVANQCEIVLGGAWGNTASYTEIGTRQLLVAGELEIGTRYGAGTSTSRLFTQTRTVDLFDGDQTNTVNFAVNATQLQMGSTGGSTTIRNTLNVLASAVVEGNIRLDGGLNAGILEIGRGKFGTTIIPHNVGGLENPNIDFYKYQSTGKFIDTAGVSTWGSNAFLLAGGQIASIDTIVNNGAASRPSATYSFLTATTTGIGTGATFTVLVRADSTIDITVESPGSGYVAGDTLTIGNDQLGGGVGGGDLTFNVGSTNDAGQTYFLPITTPTITDFKVGDLLLIDRGDAASPDSVGVAPNQLTGLRDEAQSEIVRVIGLANVANPSDPNGYRLIVNRGQEGTGVYDNHPDNCVIAKLVKQSNASFITGSDLDLDGNVDIPESGISNGAGNVRIGVAEFGGTISTRDLLRLTASEFVSIEDLISTSPQSLSVNDGGSPAAEVFKVESTTGDTYIFGDILAGTGFNRFTVDSDTGNTITQGTLTTNNTLTVRGSTFAAEVGSADFEQNGAPAPFANSQLFKLTPQGNTEFLTLTNGGTTGTQEAVTFQVDTATGSIYSLGDMRFYGKDENGVADQTVPRLEFINSSGDFTVYGSLSALGSGPSTFGGSIVVNTGGLDMTFRDGGGEAQDRRVVVKDENEGEMFSIESDGAMQIAGINNYFTRTGGNKWVNSSNTVIQAEANVNYFVNPGGNTLFKLPTNPLIGDTIRIIDISGALTYDRTLVVRAPDDVKVQGELSNTGSAVLTGVSPSAYAGHNGGELVVQTPHAAFGLVYAGALNPDGSSSTVPSAQTGWYLMDV